MDLVQIVALRTSCGGFSAAMLPRKSEPRVGHRQGVWKAVGRKPSAKQENVWHCACGGRLPFTTAPKSPKDQWGAFRGLGEKREERGWTGHHCPPLRTALQPSMVHSTEGRGSRLRKENPREPYAVWETKTRALRVRQLPTNRFSCGNQPAHIRLIIVAAAALDPLCCAPGRAEMA